MIEYLSPLVKGVPQVPYRNGLPDYIGLSHLDVKKQKYSDWLKNGAVDIQLRFA